MCCICYSSSFRLTFKESELWRQINQQYFVIFNSSFLIVWIYSLSILNRKAIRKEAKVDTFSYLCIYTVYDVRHELQWTPHLVMSHCSLFTRVVFSLVEILRYLLFKKNNPICVFEVYFCTLTAKPRLIKDLIIGIKEVYVGAIQLDCWKSFDVWEEPSLAWSVSTSYAVFAAFVLALLSCGWKTHL